MSSYDETLDGRLTQRPAPGQRHELICRRLHEALNAALPRAATTQRLAPRSEIQLSFTARVRPDLALVTAASQKLWLAAEIVGTEDHRIDTVTKKQIYEEWRVPRLWMIDPRYDNLEVYHGTQHGLALKAILAGNDVLSEPLLPGFELTIADLFRT